MFKNPSLLPERVSEARQSAQGQNDINIQRAFWSAIIFTIVAFTSVALSIYLIFVYPVWQVFMMAVIALLAFVLDMISVILIRRNQAGLGLKIMYWSGLFTIPANVVLFTGMAPILIVIVLVIGFVEVFLLFPPHWRKYSQFGPVLAAAVMFLVEFLNPPFRFNMGIVPTSGYFGQVVLGFVVLGVIVLVVRQAWSGNIRVKLVVSFIVVTLVAVGIVGVVSYINFQKQVRADIRQRLANIAGIVATQQDGDLHAAIQIPEDMTKDAYQKMMAQGNKIITAVPDLAYIYTMRKDEQGQIYFVVDAEGEGNESVPVGEVYKEPSALLLENFDTLDHTIVEEDFYTDEYGTVISAYAPIYRADGTREAIVGVDIFADKVVAQERTALGQERTALTQIMVSAIAAMLLVVGIGLYLGTLLTKPITNLYNEVQKITNGDLSARAKIETSDEVGNLAKAFNTMASELQEILQDLEARVAERTRNLELAAEVGRTVSRVRALDVMLKEAAELIREQFDLYYVQVYLTDPGQTNLILQSGTGKVGAELVGLGHRLPLNIGSINGRAAVEKNSVVISDTAASLTFRPNPLLPDTCSEMAVPLLVGEKVVGVLDMQSTQAGALSQDMLPAFEALAGQLAIAIQNANLLAEANLARAEVEAQTRHLVRTGWQDYLDAIHQPEHIGFVFEKNQILPFEETETSRSPQGASALSASISVTGEKLGELIVEMEEEKQTTQTVELINIVARQVSQQIENLRLLDSAERYRTESEEASRRLTHQGWKDYTDANAAKGLSYTYDLKEVRPFNQAGDQQAEKSGLSLPLKVRDETIGELVIQGLGADDSEALELANLVSERLSAHIENLRLSEQTQERAQREQALRQITSAVRGSTDPATILRAAVRELGTLLGRKTVIRLATTDQASQSQRPTEFVGDSAATSGNEPIPPTEAPIADGGDE
jgi:GAF domain-containing protein/HAMP domain-containing protein